MKGRYDFTLKWTFDESQAPTDGSAAPAIFTAIQEQIGLKLEPVRAPTDVLVVDKVERPGAIVQVGGRRCGGAVARWKRAYPRG